MADANVVSAFIVYFSSNSQSSRDRRGSSWNVGNMLETCVVQTRSGCIAIGNRVSRMRIRVGPILLHLHWIGVASFN